MDSVGTFLLGAAVGVLLGAGLAGWWWDRRRALHDIRAYARKTWAGRSDYRRRRRRR